MSLQHSVFVLSKDGAPLTPTTPTRARKLLEAGVAKPAWAKFGTFGVQMLMETRRATAPAALGIDHGAKFEGYAVVIGTANPLNVKLDLPDKARIVRKLVERRVLRRARRLRLRHRPARFDNRQRAGFLAPSQRVMVYSRLKVIRELLRCYPIRTVGYEDVKFNHAKHRWGANFSTVEIGKAHIKHFLLAQGTTVREYAGHQTQALRKQYGYRKTKVKNADTFTAHCSDALTLAVDVLHRQRVAPGPFLVVDDTYRCVRRRLHDTQFSAGGVRHPYSRGTVFGYRKGSLIGLQGGEVGRLCGAYKGIFRYYTPDGKRRSTTSFAWASNHFVIRKEERHSSTA